MITSSKYLIASYTHRLNGKHTTLGGPAVALAKYLGRKAYCIWQPIEPNKPQWYYWLMKLRDIWLVVMLHKPAKVFIGVESVNALLGKLLGYKKVIYWNLDYSPSRGWVWLLMDRLAIRYADEVWTLSERGYKTVPIGYWKIYKSKKRDPVGIVYIGLLQDGQGVEGLLWYARMTPEINVTIIGTGKDETKYKRLATKNVKFTGLISDKEARKIMLANTYGWLYYHKDNPTHKTTPPTKPVTYFSCGLIQLTDEHPYNCSKWKDIFKYVLNDSSTHNKKN